VLGGLTTEFSPGITAAIQICAAAFVLVYSLLIGGGEFALKEYRHLGSTHWIFSLISGGFSNGDLFVKIGFIRRSASSQKRPRQQLI
jgi:hypothetical protein